MTFDPRLQYRPSRDRDERTRLARLLADRIAGRPLAVSLRLDEAEAIIEALLKDSPR